MRLLKVLILVLLSCGFATAQLQVVYTRSGLAVASAPTFSPTSPYTGTATTVVISDVDPGAAILYCQDTINTCTPSTVYTTPISVASTGYIRAQGTLVGVTSSSVVSWQGTINSTLSPGWTFLQDTFVSAQTCTVGATSCTIATLPTTAGSVWAVQTVSGNNVTIQATHGWTLCPSSNCHIFPNVTGANNMDAAYQIGGAAGTTSVTIDVSSATSTFWGASFVEMLPPAGYTASFDTSGSQISSACTTCTAVPLTLAATDAVVEFQIEQHSSTSYNNWSSPFIADGVLNGIGLNIPNGSMAAPTLTQSASGTLGFSALAFKSTAGSFTTPTPVFSISNVTFANSSGTSCSPSCSVTVPSTGSGHLLFAHAASSSGSISSATGAGTWVIPSGASTCAASQTSLFGSCAYVLSSTSGVTTLNFTMSATGTYGIVVYEIARTSGSFVLDVQNSNTLVSTTMDNVGPSLTLGGTNDVIFQEYYDSGAGAISGLYYPQPYDWTLGSGFQLFWGGADTGILLNTANGSAAQWLPLNNTTGKSAMMSAVAFK